MALSQEVMSSGEELAGGGPQALARPVVSHAAVVEYVASLDVDGSLGRVVEITRFMRGENHAVYRVGYVDQRDVERDVVVRIANADSEADRAQAGRESAVLAHLRGAASPRLIDYRTGGPFAGHAVMCLEHVDGSCEPLDTAPPDRLANLGAAVRRTHSIPVDDLALVLRAAPDLSTYVENRGHSMLARMPLVQDPLPEAVQRRFRDVAAWAQQAIDRLRVTEDAGTPVLLHGDVSAGNVLWTPQPVLIDWEYARIGDPADETGYVFGQNAFAPDQREGFWRGYGDGLEPASLGRVVERAASWEPLTLFGSALYWVDLWSRGVRAEAIGSVDSSAPKDPSYYLEHATRYLDRIGSS
jgi:aminoglycoside phosphotransferase (APT) family kinase protein